MFAELFDMPIAYDMGIDLTGTLQRKPHRKGKKIHNLKKKEVVVMTSKEIANLSGKVLEKLLTKSFNY